mmetsp:Transcript_108957/g.331361  ORF Transcript_108957/g.331361 Transcript_108957/m.331361 type:complete len:270 (+) Transcript_108957:2-811(+)
MGVHRGAPPEPVLAGVQQIEYVAGADGGNACPPGTAPLTELECRSAHAEFGGVPNEHFAVSSSEDPRGCFKFAGPSNFWYHNSHHVGAPKQGRTPYCKRLHSGVAAKPDIGECPQGTGLNHYECYLTALKLGTPNREFQEKSMEHPKGCFRFSGPHRYFYFNAAPGGISDPARTLYCKSVPPVHAVTGSANSCPDGAVIMAISECRRAAQKMLHMEPGTDFEISSTEEPRGCFSSRPSLSSPPSFHYNTDYRGKAREGSKPLCKRIASS